MPAAYTPLPQNKPHTSLTPALNSQYCKFSTTATTTTPIPTTCSSSSSSSVKPALAVKYTKRPSNSNLVHDEIIFNLTA